MSLQRAAALAALAGLSAFSASAQQTLPGVTVTAPAPGLQTPPSSPEVERFSLPQTRESIDQKKIADTVNIVDTQDGIKYLPSIFVRKRNNGDTQPTVATRTWGINSSARTLVFVDDVPIAALISNNNTTGAPRWGMVAPEEVKGMDMLYGPYSAAYPGNSMGGVLLISTRMPEKLEFTAKQTAAFQSFDMYRTSGTYSTSNTAVTVGDKVGRVSFFLSANREENFSQPLQFVTNGSATPAGTTGTIQQLNKQGAAANVVGAGGLLHTIMTNLKLKAAVDVTDWLRATWSIGYWNNDTQSTVQTYLTANGNPTFGGVAGFASNTNKLAEQHLMNTLSLKTDTGGDWDWEAIYTRYDYLQSVQRSPAGVLASGTNFTTNGLIAQMDGTGWTTQNLKGIWRPTGIKGDHELSFGLHRDQYKLNNPTYTAANWLNSTDTGTGVTTTFGAGKTETWGLWLQDAWKFAPGFKLTLGGRAETWRAYDGYNLAGATSTVQPGLQSTNFSPKASLSWQADSAWSTKLSFGQAWRYPTVSELYQIVATGPIFAVPNPNLLPESALSFEWSVERQDKNSRLRVTLFEDDTSNALIQQTNFINNTFVNTWQNVGLVRNRGIEVAGELKDVFIPGLTLGGSATYVDSEIVSNPGFVSTTGTTSTGKRAPYVPDWRATAQVTYRPNENWAFTTSARYQGTMYSTLDNSDIVPNVQGAFDRFFVVDIHARYQITEALSADIGIDNVNDHKYFEFHPFPGRTFLASLKAKF